MRDGHLAQAQRWSQQIEADLNVAADPEAYGRPIRLKVQVLRGDAQRRALEDALRFFREQNDLYGMGNVYWHLLYSMKTSNDLAGIPPLLAEARAFFDVNPTLPRDLYARFLTHTAIAEALLGNFAGAREDITRALELATSTKLGWYVVGLFHVGAIEGIAGNFDQAAAHYAEVLKSAAPIEAKIRLDGKLAEAGYRVLAGDIDHAARVLRESLELVDEVNDLKDVMLGEAALVAALIAVERGSFAEAVPLRGFAEAKNVVLVGGVGKWLIDRLDTILNARFEAGECESLHLSGLRLTTTEAAERVLNVI